MKSTEDLLREVSMLQGMIRPLEETLVQVSAERDEYKVQAEFYYKNYLDLKQVISQVEWAIRDV